MVKLYEYEILQTGYMEADSEEELKQELETLGWGYDYEPCIEVKKIKFHKEV